MQILVVVFLEAENNGSLRTAAKFSGGLIQSKGSDERLWFWQRNFLNPLKNASWLLEGHVFAKHRKS